MFFLRAVGFKNAVRGKDPLAISVVEAEPDIKVRSGLGQIKIDFNFEPRADREPFSKRLFVFGQELQTSEQWSNNRPPISHAAQLNHMARPTLSRETVQIKLNGVL